NGQAGSNGAAQTGDNETKANSASDAGNVTSGTNETTDNGSSGTIGTADNSGAGTEGTADNGGTGADGTANNGTSGTDATADNGSSDTGHGYEKYDYSLGLDPEKPIIALSFDDGPSSFTDRIVAALQANHVEATFFMVGYNISAFKDTVRLVYDAGMEIGNHTSNHKNLSKIKEKEIRSEVFDNEDLLNTIVPVGKIIVRPPYGALNSTVKSIVNRPMFNWSVDSLDWKTRDADSIVAQIQQDARDGYVILMHDLYESTAEAAERIIPWLIDHGYQLTTVSKLFKARGVETENGELYRMAQPAELR
ncbi:MAG: polysaccharide deacetylase family protein, partial [Lachnospiraceae bacterium]|nr:polysaccharide deacetylase family protein [Lachnospiraceae bacterium]